MSDGRGDLHGRMLAAVDDYARGLTSANRAGFLAVKTLRMGCGDNSCYFRRPTGMGTNGGCRCQEVIESMLYRAVQTAKEPRSC